MEEQSEIRVISKYDFELSKSEVKKIFGVYNECFYNSQCTRTKLIKQAHRLIGASHIWRWYLAYLGSDLIGIAAYVYDTTRIGTNDFDIQVNIEAGENICNVGVRSKFRRRGVARCLMQEIIDDYHGKDLVVEVIKGCDLYMGIMQLYLDLDFSELLDGKFDNDKVRYLIKSQDTEINEGDKK